jgi:hypothetical protein
MNSLRTSASYDMKSAVLYGARVSAIAVVLID